MSSRKRNKGKDRKARKEENKRVEMRNKWQSWARGEFERGHVTTTCAHGGDEMILSDNNHPVCSFMDTFFDFDNRGTMSDILENTFQKHPKVWKSESYREIAVNILVRIGTNFLLSDRAGLRFFARAIAVLENSDGSGDIESTVNCHVVATKYRDLHCTETSIKRDLLKFFRKRVSCKCLKDMHLEARKSLPKLGVCNHCLEKAGRSSLMVCSRCRIAQYCSRECQIAAWSRHKGFCDNYVRCHEHQKMNCEANNKDATS